MQSGFYGDIQIIAVLTVVAALNWILLSESLLAEVEEENEYIWLIFF